MRRISILAVVLFVAAVAGAAQAEIIIDSLVRETSASVVWTEDPSYSFEDGQRVDDLVAPGVGTAYLSTEAGGMGGLVTVTQNTNILFATGSTIISGAFAFSAANEAGVESLQLGGFNRMSMAFRADPAVGFMVPVAASDGAIIVRLRDAAYGTVILEIDSDWSGGSSIAPLGGSGAYVFEVVADMDFAPGRDTTPYSGSCSFELMLFDSSVDGEPATLGGLKALYR